MPNDFMPSNKTIDDIVQSTNGPEGLEAMGQAIKDHIAATEQVAAAPAPKPVLSAPQPRPTTMRRFYIGNNSFEIYSTSDADLNEQESQIRALYSSRS